MLSPLSLFSLLLCFIFSDGEGGGRRWPVVAARWPVVVEPPLKSSFFQFFFAYSLLLLLLCTFLHPKFPNTKPKFLDLQKNETKERRCYLYVPFASGSNRRLSRAFLRLRRPSNRRGLCSYDCAIVLWFLAFCRLLLWVTIGSVHPSLFWFFLCAGIYRGRLRL